MNSPVIAWEIIRMMWKTSIKCFVLYPLIRLKEVLLHSIRFFESCYALSNDFDRKRSASPKATTASKVRGSPNSKTDDPKARLRAISQLFYKTRTMNAILE